MMKSLSFLCSKNTLFGMMIGFVLASLLAFKIMSDPPNCAISLDKMNVFYTGVDNPITIVARGVLLEQLTVQGEGVTVKKEQGDRYTVRATTPGDASITVSGGDLAPKKFIYRIKRFPDPLLCLGGNPRNRGGSMGSGEFRAQGGISAQITGMDICGDCSVVSYQITFASKRQDPVTVINAGGRFGPKAQALINRAQPGDQYIFDEVKVKCPGDVAARDLGSLAFKIK